MAQGDGRKTRAAGTFGTVHQLPSGRFRALYYGPDGRRYKAPTTFTAKQDARGWLSLQQADIIRKAWTPPTAQTPTPKRTTFTEYANDWLEHRSLKDRTREHYRKLLDGHILPTLGALPLASITPDDVRDWHTGLGNSTPTMRAHAYGLVRTILASAASEGRIAANPCHIRGAGSAKRVHKIRPASLAELQALTAAMPENQQAMILLASWCALRFGELTELRRKDIEITEEKDGDETVKVGVIRVRRAVVRVSGEFKVTTPKSDAGIRDVAIPPHLIPAIENHMAEHVGPEKDALLFPAGHGGHLAPATLYRQFYKARAEAGRDDLRFHDLRHGGAVLAAATGASLAELMVRLGHSTPQAAMRYQHAAQGRDKQIAALLSKLAEGEQ
ncbi:tyrosine-type recombinase/integrase [Aldersonia kunmingensis]|uniref:tyrosine-type recombinase/integrase n=1 Tax=Aldersonia kunmingensis TaxID=408066 RepID=UPI00083146C3|nr:site-specific integrase [Aldersonia kunmingensis]